MTFAGFLNQSEIPRAYVAADCIVLPSDYGETWGLVVNEAMGEQTKNMIADYSYDEVVRGTLAALRYVKGGGSLRLRSGLRL